MPLTETLSLTLIALLKLILVISFSYCNFLVSRIQATNCVLVLAESPSESFDFNFEALNMIKNKPLSNTSRSTGHLRFFLSSVYSRIGFGAFSLVSRHFDRRSLPPKVLPKLLNSRHVMLHSFRSFRSVNLCDHFNGHTEVHKCVQSKIWQHRR